MTAPGQAYTGEHQCTYGWGKCGRTDTHPYVEGARCPDHTPAKLAGLPEPDSKRYCMAICYCGSCPHRRKQPLAPIRETVIDLNAVRSGKRRSSPAAYRQAQQARTEKTA